MDTFNLKLSQLERALEISNEMFEDCPEWQKLPEESKLRFSVALVVAFKNLKKET